MNTFLPAIPFVKASACGNDFLIIERGNIEGDLVSLTRRLCDRHNGVGADGVEWLSQDADPDVDASIHLLNADGSHAEISGNGTRCVAAYLSMQKPAERFVIRTGAGLKVCTLVSHEGVRYEFETAMGKPKVGAERSVKINSGTIFGIPVSMGNPHFVIFRDVLDDDWRERAEKIGGDTSFPDGVNVEMVRVQDRNNLEAHFFERGAGETQSSGTGTCASAAAAIASGRCTSPVHVHAPGGTQTVHWDKEIVLRGSAQIVCRGEFFL
jgi:diaminopimelate epimerase